MQRTQLSYCAEQVRRYDNDRFICNLHAPPAEREALSALHAFNLEIARIREAAREPLLGQMRLRWWAETLDAVFAGRPPKHDVAAALADAVQRFRLHRAPLDRILEARAFDLENRAPETLADLLDYARDTSASLAQAGVQVLDAGDGATRAAADEVGVAWALVGLARAVPFHARARRVYLPAELNRDCGLDVFRLYGGCSPPGLPEVIERLMTVAQEHLSAARARRREVDSRALPVLLPATIADLYIERLRRAGWDPFEERVNTPAPGRLIRTAAARLRRRY